MIAHTGKVWRSGHESANLEQLITVFIEAYAEGTAGEIPTGITGWCATTITCGQDEYTTEQAASIGAVLEDALRELGRYEDAGTI